MSKYAPLGEFLRAQRTAEVPMTFDDVERIVGAKLPPKAQHNRAWWSNNPSNNVMTKVWLAAGYESAQVDMRARKLVFLRARTVGAAKSSTSAEAERHPLFGALSDLTHIPPGVDLTAPADPGWADLLDADDTKY
jgi:hypothetical protein